MDVTGPVRFPSSFRVFRVFRVPILYLLDNRVLDSVSLPERCVGEGNALPEPAMTGEMERLGWSLALAFQGRTRPG
jgi:hypothetical protein